MTPESSNIIYRDPALYDHLFGDDDSPAQLVAELIDTHGPAEARTLLDFGCGTGRDLAYLSDQYSCVGVDLQHGMIDHGRRTRPELDLRVGDMRTVRLGQTVDAIICLGNSLSYLHQTADLRAAFDTFAAHADRGTVLIIQTLISNSGSRPPATSTVDVAGTRAAVTVSSDWNLRDQTLTVHRHWSFIDGRQETDLIHRRVIFPRELELLLTLSGFELLETFDNVSGRGSALIGPSAHVVARWLGDVRMQNGSAVCVY